MEEFGNVGYVDESGILVQATEKPAQFVAYESEPEVQQALNENTVQAYFVVSENYLRTGKVQLHIVGSAPEALSDEISAYLLANVAGRASN